MKSYKEKMIREDLDNLLSTFSDTQVPAGISLAGSVMKTGVSESFSYNSGHTELINQNIPVSAETFFDLASLTKPLVTALSLYILMESGKVSLSTTLNDLFNSKVIPVDKQSIQIYHLLSHSSGLAAHKNYFVKALGLLPGKRKEYILSAILSDNLQYRTSSDHLYSDLGYILLGYIIETITGDPLDRFFADNIAKPLGLADSLLFKFKERQAGMASCAMTEVCAWTNTWLEGKVHDDNCRVMGGVAGHAGLFGTSHAVLRVCEALIDVWQGNNGLLPIKQRSLMKFLEKLEGSTWRCGFDTPTTLYSSSGRFFGKNSIGHLGYTGTSFWIDLDRGTSIVLLTNRVHPTRQNEFIKRLRPLIHNIIMEKLIS